MAVAYGIGKVKSLRSLKPHPPLSKQTKKKVSANLLPSINKEVIFEDLKSKTQKNFPLYPLLPLKKRHPSKKKIYLVKLQIRNHARFNNSRMPPPGYKMYY